MEEKLQDAANELSTSPIEKRANEIGEGRIGEEITTDTTESPIEEARRLNVETKGLLKTIEQKKAELDKSVATAMMMGRADAGQENKPITQADKDKAEAEKMLAGFR